MKSNALDGKTIDLWVTSNLRDPAMSLLEVVDKKFVIPVAKRDGEQVAADPNDYASKNWISYYLLVNTWLLQVKEVSERGCLELLDAISKQGLLATIADCDGLANDFIASYASGNNLDGVPPYLHFLLTACGNDKELLQLLRYPKRFSPDGADLVTRESVDELLRINTKCKMLNRAGFEGWGSSRESHKSITPSRYWVDRIQSRLSEMLAGYDLDTTDGIFSTGVAADARRPLAAKLDAYSAWECCLYGDPMYPISHGANAVRWHNAPYHSKLFCAHVEAVPKSFKRARIIAEEHVYRQYGMQAIRREIEKCIDANGYRDYLDLHSQIRNQMYANLGSRSGIYATIDLSSASDSVSRTLAYEVLPSKLVSDVDKFLPRTFICKGSQRTMHMFCTSGSAVTFPVESIIFLAIALEVREVVTALTGEFYLPPCVFGDDIVTDTLLYDTTTDVLEQLGFVVNSAKSYGPGTLYRESCGCEYVCGYDLQSRYWPRSTFTWNAGNLPAVLAQLTALQHQLYATYPCRAFLVKFIRGLEPRMTSHVPGTECVDLWETIPVYQIVYAPGLDEGTGAGAERQRHLTLKTRYRGNVSKPQSSGFSYPELVRMWRYSTFLRHGPRYDSELQRLLGVSSKPTPVIHDCVAGELYWGYTTE